LQKQKKKTLCHSWRGFVRPLAVILLWKGKVPELRLQREVGCFIQSGRRQLFNTAFCQAVKGNLNFQVIFRLQLTVLKPE